MMKTKTFFKTLIIALSANLIYAQVPDFQWNQSHPDYSNITLTTAHDGGIISLGTDGNNDYVIRKYNLGGDLEWEKIHQIGENESFSGYLHQAADGGYTYFANDYFEDENGYTDDYFLVKTNAVGDFVSSIPIDLGTGIAGVSPTSDGGFLFNTELDEFSSGLVKINSNGDILWETNPQFYVMDANETQDGGYIIAGDASQTIRIQKLNPDRNVIWEQTLNHQFELGWIQGLQQTPDGGYVCLINLNEYIDQNSIPHNWVVKFSAGGELLWENIYNNQVGTSLIVADNGDITVASDNDVLMGYHPDGSVKWYLNLQNQSYMYQLIKTSDNGFAFTAEIPFVEQFGTKLVKLTADNLSLTEITKNQVNVFPNPTKDFLNFSQNISEISVYDFSGKLLKSVKDATNKIEVNQLPKGNYIIQFTDENGKVQTSKFIKN